ncbi:Rieske 2Fe-2S domain-containing protein [Zavarzinia sp.]|uniref:Rieske 2Fe-2S domain-containing protein n=1 Tax=Zavarzinia sp. TaxID=2027920 RepID=UPI00356217B8
MSARFFPVASGFDLAPRHVFQGLLFDQELALWRDDQGRVNAWENRCPHRGVRLTIGHNLGGVLKCQYHGWRYASGSGTGVTVPAHPGAPIPAAICAKVFPALEVDGIVFAALEEAPPPVLPQLPAGARIVLRPRPVASAPAAVAERLAGFRFGDFAGRTFAQRPTTVETLDPFTIRATADVTILFLLQPRGAGTMIHGILVGAPAAARGAVDDLLSDLLEGRR